MADSGYDEHEYDVVIIGAGGAGLRAAIESARQGAKTAIITKGQYYAPGRNPPAGERKLYFFIGA